MKQYLFTAAVVLALLALVGVPLAPIDSAAATEVVAIDDDHELADDRAIEEYEDRGETTVSHPAPELTLTIADDREAVDRDSVILDSDTYLRVQYHEDVERSIRLYVPEEYWTPYEDQGIESLDGGVDGEMEPVEIDGETFTAVTLHFDGKTDAVVAIDGVEDGLWGLRDSGWSILNGTSPIALPRFSSPDDNPWEYVDSEDFAASSYDTNATDVIVEYDATSDGNETTWTEAPTCDSDEPICTMDRAGSVSIEPADDDPPAVRYKTDPSLRDKIGTGARGIGGDIGDLVDNITDLLED